MGLTDLIKFAVKEPPSLADLRRVLFAGRTEAYKILNALTHPRAIQVMALVCIGCSWS